MSGLQNKVVLVTGAGSGIGAGVSALLAKHGAHVAVTGRNEASLQDTAELCRKEGASDDKILIVTGDLTIESDLDKIVQTTVERFGRLDALVNNAGIPISGNLASCSYEDFDAAMATNTRAPFLLTQKCVPHLIDTKGTIVNISSTAGFRANPIMVGYCCSKRALDVFTKALALELGPKGVRVNSVNPSTVEDTNIFLKHGSFVAPDKKDEYFQKMRDNVPLKRLCSVRDVAEATINFISDDTSFTTGCVLPVDGGYRCKTGMQYKKYQGTVKH